MPVETAPALPVTEMQRVDLQRMAVSSSLPHRQVVQARALLWAADGVANQEIARRVEVDSDTVRRWRQRFADTGVDGVGVIAKGRGRKSSLPPGVVEEVVRLTHQELPADGSTHWSMRSMAARVGIGKDSVAQIWADHNLKPWRVDTFKISNDPRFEEELVDVRQAMRQGRQSFSSLGRAPLSPAQTPRGYPAVLGRAPLGRAQIGAPSGAWWRHVETRLRSRGAVTAERDGDSDRSIRLARWRRIGGTV